MSLDAPTIARRESGTARRSAIAEAARALIVEKGLEGLRTRDIAARVGINIATLHYHVPSKEALIALVAESLRHEFRDQAIRRPRAGRSGMERLRMEFEDFSETVRDTPDLIVVMTHLIERGRRDPAINCIILPLYDFWRVQFVEIVELGIADGSFRADADPHAAALIVIGALSDYWRAWNRSQARLESVFAELERAFAP